MLDLDLISDLLDGQEVPVALDRVLADEALPPLLTDEAIASMRYGPSFEDILARLGSLVGCEGIDAWYWLALINMRRGAWSDPSARYILRGAPGWACPALDRTVTSTTP